MDGKTKCRILKGIRNRIAEENGIDFRSPECNYHGDCQGSCPQCDSELRTLERALTKHSNFGKAITITGLALTLTGCNTLRHGPDVRGKFSTPIETIESGNHGEQTPGNAPAHRPSAPEQKREESEATNQQN